MKILILLSLLFCTFANGQKLTVSKLKKLTKNFGYKTQKGYTRAKVASKISSPFLLPYLYSQTKKRISKGPNYIKFNSVEYKKNDQNLQHAIESSVQKCSAVCPNNINILNLNAGNLKRSDKNSLSFVNNAYEFSKVMKYDYGFCWGHSSMTSLLKNLAFFDPEGCMNDYGFYEKDENWEEYVITALVDIFNSKPRVIPFIKNIKELSQLFEAEMKAMVIEKWTEKALHPRNYKIQADNKNAYSEAQLLAITNELEYRISQGQKPEIMFNIWDSTEWIHVSLVEQVKRDRNRNLIHIKLDDNKVFNNIVSLLENESVLTINLGSKEIHYSNAERFETTSSRIGRLVQTDSNYLMYNKILPKLVNFCKAQTECIEDN